MVLKMNNQCLYVACSRCGQILKELTDEEIALTWNEFSALQSPKDIKDFARAILLKAQEK